MNLDEVKLLWVAKYNLFTDVPWIGTIDELLKGGIGQFKVRTALSSLAYKTDEDSLKTMVALSGTIIGIAQTREEAEDIVERLRRDLPP